MSATPADTSPRPPHGRHRPDATPVLVLEDSDDDFDTVLEAFRAGGHVGDVRRATSGDECLKRLRDAFDRSAIAEDRPAVVLMDLNVPGLDGRDALRVIKKDERLRSLPVVVHTTSAHPNDLELCYSRGANAYHVKPVSYPKHLEVLQRVFGYWLKSVVLPEGVGGGRHRA